MRKSAQELRAIWVAGNEYLQAAAPWATIKEEPEVAAMQIRLGLNLIALYATLSAPFIPDAAQKMHAALQVDGLDWPSSASEALTTLAAGQSFDVPENLFAKISDDDRQSWQDRFSGVRV